MSTQRLVPPGSYIETLNGSHLTKTPVDDDRSFHLAELICTDVVPPDEAAIETLRAYKDGLPHQDFWEFDPRKYKISTPVDEFGLIDDVQLIKDVKATIKPGYLWTGDSDRHHLYWTQADYARVQAETPVRALAFRNSPQHIVRVQRIFHNWVHAVTLPPPMPSPEIMSYRVEAWSIASGFFKMVQSTSHTSRVIERERERRDGFTEVQERLLNAMMRRETEGVLRHVDDLAKLPEEHVPVDLNLPFHIAAGQIGHIVRQGAKYKTKEIRKAA